MLGSNLDTLHAVARALLDRETLNSAEFEEVFQSA